jgi:hypothetical protein
VRLFGGAFVGWYFMKPCYLQGGIYPALWRDELQRLTAGWWFVMPRGGIPFRMGCLHVTGGRTGQMGAVVSNRGAETNLWLRN